MSFPIFDVWDQALLTDIVTKPLTRATETQDFLGESIAPMQDFDGTVAKLRVQDVKPFGKGQFRAPGATPPFFKPSVTWREELIGLALPDEMEEIDEESWMKLNSSDENIRAAAGLDLVRRGQILRLRNERATEWMRWQAFAGNLVITYPDGEKWQIDYGLPVLHKPTAGVLWSTVATADPVADVQAWSEQIANTSGFYGTKLHMSSKVWDYLIRNAKIKADLTFNSRAVKRPRREDILELFESFATNVDVIVYDNGYRETSSTGEGLPALTKYLPDTHVLLTTDYSIDGQNIAETLDGLVTISTGYNETALRNGMQAEVMLDHMSKTHFFRVAARRIPRLLVPECFLYAKVA